VVEVIIKNLDFWGNPESGLNKSTRFMTHEILGNELERRFFEYNYGL
jgi:hypothetical protein